MLKLGEFGRMLEDLQQLKSLRDDGTLTEEEFLAAKDRILNEPKSRSRLPMIIAGIAAALLLTVAATYIMSSKDQSLPTSVASDNGRAEVNSATTPDSSQKQSEKLALALDTDILGKNPAWVESKLGPASSKSGEYWYFDVDGCDIGYHIAKDAIASANVSITDECHPTINGITFDGTQTFGDVYTGDPNFAPDCLGLCGNSHDPYTTYYDFGYHARGYVTYFYTSVATDAQLAWADDIEQRLGMDLPDAWQSEEFECPTQPPSAAVIALYSKAVIEDVGFSLDLTKPGCPPQN